ncbi:uncharacterized protein LOC131020468 isoform X2 [Salvia miltiorrhiza]|uniref:uncharacterized protein LOC131020468 isoform X2 n=1 Tax=Salvia miltiorrhiza TaxID=226208 RepID=UPI0025ACDA1B|nr:uncharacterized protein LOC131020468 isoform X2 [Salvia miltiorrhiza]
MDSSMKTGLMTVFAVSGSVVFVAMQVHKRLLSKFMEKIEYEIETASKEEPKKKVRFADDVAETENRKVCEKAAESGKFNDENLEALPENWQAMYREILHQRNYLRTCN